MQHKKLSIGPRGWAMLTLVGGAAFASPFLRPPQIDVEMAVTESPLAHSHSPGRLASAQLAHEHSVPRSLEIPDWSELPADSPGGAHRTEPQFPAWATPPSPLEQLISQGSAPPWRHESEQRKLQPLSPWVDGPHPAGAVPSTQPLHSLGTASPPWPVEQPWEAPASVAATSSQRRGAESTMRADPTGLDTNRPMASLTGTTLPAPPAAVSAPPHATSGANAATVTLTRPAQFVYQPGYRQPAAPR